MPMKLMVKLGGDTFEAEGDDFNESLVGIFAAWVKGHDPEDAAAQAQIDRATADLGASGRPLAEVVDENDELGNTGSVPL